MSAIRLTFPDISLSKLVTESRVFTLHGVTVSGAVISALPAGNNFSASLGTLKVFAPSKATLRYSEVFGSRAPPR